MTDETGRRTPTPSRSAAAAAVRWSDSHPEEDIEHAPPASPAERDGDLPTRHSASVEAASLRWEERHPD
jgi:hypothetical protein